ncbi:hypothetical protein GGQ80_001796 [Sphingomonas jinjuensis]|uniref:Uncharacterized protein n=1 Tax=Sphingomonas jinjuensis TaxID=535907 RepID=A0A840F7G7_9SPHN|nr:hypothetical protein [Sphingomonas jinjuensis]MBB4153890.1 hypothetical protein [Sphingomonas jinjuensis]
MQTFPTTAAPASFVPLTAMAYTADSGEAVAIDAAHPLPITTRLSAAASVPLTGSAAASSVAGPFTPDKARPIWLTLSGSWSGSVTVQRSTDGGATKQPLTVAGQPWGVFTANANEIVAEETVEGATYYLTITIASGLLSYRVAQ